MLLRLVVLPVPHWRHHTRGKDSAASANIQVVVKPLVLLTLSIDIRRIINFLGSSAIASFFTKPALIESSAWRPGHASTDKCVLDDE